MTNTGTGIDRKTLTNQDGLYRADNLVPGIYAVKAASKGFSSLALDGVILETGATKTIDLTLTVGTVESTVTVQSVARAVNLETV